MVFYSSTRKFPTQVIKFLAYVDISNEEYKENVNNMVIYYKFNETDIWSNETSSNMTEFNSTDAGLNLTDGEMHGAGIQVRSLSGLYGLDGNGTAENSGSRYKLLQLTVPLVTIVE